MPIVSVILCLYFIIRLTRSTIVLSSYHSANLSASFCPSTGAIQAIRGGWGGESFNKLLISTENEAGRQNNLHANIRCN